MPGGQVRGRARKDPTNNPNANHLLPARDRERVVANQVLPMEIDYVEPGPKPVQTLNFVDLSMETDDVQLHPEAALTINSRERRNARKRELYAENLEKETEAQRQERVRKRAESQRQRRDRQRLNENDDGRAQRLAVEVGRRANQTLEQREMCLANHAARNTERRANFTPEQRSQIHARDIARQRDSRRPVSSALARCGDAVASIESHDIGQLNCVCPFCGAMHFKDEKTKSTKKYRLCCDYGKVSLPPLGDYPAYMKTLIESNTSDAKMFRTNIRSYNSALSFASMGFKSSQRDRQLPGRGPYIFTMHGQFYHRTCHLMTDNDSTPNFAQLYIIDSGIANQHRMNQPANSECNEIIMTKIDQIIRQVNPFAQAFKMMKHVMAEVRQRDGPDVSRDIRMYITSKKPNQDVHPGRCNAPTVNEVAMVFESKDGEPPSNRDICIYPSGQHHINIHPLNPNCDPMSYVLLFPNGERGWDIEKKETCKSELRYYSYRLSVRDTFSPLFYAQKLFQQYIVDAYVKIEGSRLLYLRQNQKKLRVDSYLGLMDHLNNIAQVNNLRIGVPVILPPTFIGSPRALHCNYLDAMAMSIEYGKPSLFITFTCNPKWSEITSSLLSGQAASDRPDIVARVFALKKMLFLMTLPRTEFSVK